MIESVILGIIQGLTEFLPISSSGHLLLVPYVFGWPSFGLTFDVALHFGTLLAVLIYFRTTWRDLLIKGLIQRQAKEVKLLSYLVLATIPAAVIGYLFESGIEDFVREPIIAATMIILFGLILWFVDTYSPIERTVEGLNWRQALTIGLAQVLALIPGVSRSGITMTAGRALGLSREQAAYFSFLLLAPITFGAIVTQFPEVIHSPNASEIAIGSLVSFIIGLSAIHFLLRFVNKYGFMPYVWYRLVAGLIFLSLILTQQ